MKKGLDYISDYQLNLAGKDAKCIAPYKVNQMIFAVLEDWYHHIVLKHSCKLVSLYIYIYIYIYIPIIFTVSLQLTDFIYVDKKLSKCIEQTPCLFEHYLL